ncbi:MAG: amino acid permease [Alicyclobacillus herbarius]|uniref:amino acid permease n=1 Tax=Alicyclobacillus herbarius TaxID=122960 RepID=UPI0023564F0D|nr:amino acid permease [Alicyclobacillus herbarius]MCL6631247.1 amino acid permease [Alicyclobacillus herbarius]
MQKVSDRALSQATEWLPSHHSHASGHISVWELIFIGVGGIIGAGFFLGSGQPIRAAGPSVLLAFLLGALVTTQTLGAVTSITANHPVQGSFTAFADMYLGRFTGFLQGWTYYVTSVLTIASEAVAMSVFAKLWIPHIPGWILTSVFILVVLVINAFGVKNFGRVESFMSAVKMAALVGFIVYAALFLFGVTGRGAEPLAGFTGLRVGFFPHGVTGFAQSMLIVIFAYAGIGVFATAVTKVKNPQSMDRGAWWTIILLTAMYVISVGLLLCIEPWQRMSTKTSPFVVGFGHMGLPVFGQIFNAVILVASFSVMAGAIFSANQILISLAHARVAPRFATRRKGNRQYGALVITTVCLAAVVNLSYILPSNVYSFLISASSFFTFMTWFVILWTFLVWRKKTTGDDQFVSTLAFGQPWMTIVTMVFIVILAGYALTDKDQRLGFYTCLAVWALLCAVYALFLRGKATHVEFNSEGQSPDRTNR